MLLPTRSQLLRRIELARTRAHLARCRANPPAGHGVEPREHPRLLAWPEHRSLGVGRDVAGDDEFTGTRPPLGVGLRPGMFSRLKWARVLTEMVIVEQQRPVRAEVRLLPVEQRDRRRERRAARVTGVGRLRRARSAGSGVDRGRACSFWLLWATGDDPSTLRLPVPLQAQSTARSPSASRRPAPTRREGHIAGVEEVSIAGVERSIRAQVTDTPEEGRPTKPSNHARRQQHRLRECLGECASSRGGWA